MEIPYVKMHGCQNDYLYLNFFKDRNPEFQSLDFPGIARKFSNRKTGIGSDGLILVGPPSTEGAIDAAMVMFNADGSEGKMCGNGLRCVAKLLYETLGEKPSYKIMTASGLRECQIVRVESPERMIVKANMGRPAFLPAKIPVHFDDVMVMDEEFQVSDKDFRISCISMGNPHCVIEVQDLENFPVEKYGPLIEKHEVFPEGVNVEFIERRNGKIFQRTWERGSGETLACGTGACAVGVASIMGRKQASPVEVNLRGGVLTIEWDGLREVWQTGEAVTVSHGTLSL